MPALFQISLHSLIDHYGRYDGTRAYVRRDDVVIAVGRGYNPSAAVAQALQLTRATMRLERDERARLALSLAPKLTALSVKAGAL